MAGVFDLWTTKLILLNIYTKLEKRLNQAEMTFKVASFKFSPNTPLSPWLNINFFTHQYFGFFSGTEARTNILTISDLAWQSVTYSSILSSWQKVIYPQIRNSDSHTKVLWNPLWKENSWIQYLQIGPELLKLFRDLTFTFSQPFNNLHCYFFGGGSISNDYWATQCHPVASLSVTDLKLGRLSLESQGSKHFRVLLSLSCLAPAHTRWSTVLVIIGTPCM